MSTSANTNTPTVVDRPDEHRFVVEQDGSLADLVYHLDGDRMVLEHTRVPEALGGRGIGGTLVRAALDRAAQDRLTLVPWCPFARKWLRDHPDEVTASIDWHTRPAE